MCLSEALPFGPEKVVSNIAEYGNTSAGSVPIALAEAVQEGRIKKGDVVATAGQGFHAVSFRPVRRFKWDRLPRRCFCF